MSQANRRNKQHVLEYWRKLDAAGADDVTDVARKYLSRQFVWRGPAPLEILSGPEAFAKSYAVPLKQAFPSLLREIHMFFGGSSQGKADDSVDGRMWVCGTGYFTGQQTAPFLGIPVNPKPLRLRWAEFLRFDGDTIVESQTLVDFIDWFDQIGRPVLPRSRGVPFVYPAPAGIDGILIEEQPSPETARTLALIREFLFAGLNQFDQRELKSMGVATYFHKNVKWYGPGGIGACLSLKEFEDLHQRPWLVAFPDRRVQNLDCLIAEGPFTGASGWAGVRAIHSGPYLDCLATNKQVEINGIDFWLRTDDRFTENWVFVDMIHLFSQFGIDLFSRVVSFDKKHAADSKSLEAFA